MTRPRAGGAEIDTPEGGFRAVNGQTIYIPAYSSVFTSDSSHPFNLAVTLSIRNADREHPVVIASVRYFDHDGKLIHDYLKKPLRVGPMAAVEFFVKESDTSGGVSASFLVEWTLRRAGNVPRRRIRHGRHGEHARRLVHVPRPRPDRPGSLGVRWGRVPLGCASTRAKP